jgi:hypothetical protein
VDAAGDVGGRVGLRPATVNRRPDVEDDKVRIGTMSAQPLCSHERFGMRGGDRGGQRGAEKNRRTEASDGSGRTELEKYFHGVSSLFGKPLFGGGRLPLK